MALRPAWSAGRGETMAECTPVLGGILVGVLCVLTLVLLACLARAIRGPRYTDRLIALNMICTVVILLLSVLSYGLLNLLAVAVLSRISIRRHRERREEEP